jgi:pre-mRNA-splicing factor ATP-dependent RNA helicase DHX15/PRP43
LEFAAVYFDLNSFNDGETKRALQKVVNKRLGKADSRFGANGSDGGGSGNEKRDKKRRKKN